jgi:hypothetical protein
VSRIFYIWGRNRQENDLIRKDDDIEEIKAKNFPHEIYYSIHFKLLPVSYSVRTICPIRR